MRTITSITAALVLAAAATVSAHAMGPCRDKVVVEDVQKVETSPNHYVYAVQLRNTDTVARSWEMNFHGMPQDVQVFSPSIAQQNGLQPGATTTIKFAASSKPLDPRLFRAGYDKHNAQIVLSDCQ